MSASTPADSVEATVGVCSAGVVAMIASPLGDRAAHDEGEYEREHRKAFHDRRRRHRQPENRRLALARVDGGGAALALEDADEEQRHTDERADAEQAGRGFRPDR